MRLNHRALLAAASLLALGGCAAVTAETPAQVTATAEADALMAGFVDPPRQARPRTWWHWMNGNITQDGIARDLAWMERIGLGGFQAFDANLNTPQIVDHRLVYMTPEWRDAFRFAASEAARLDLEMAIAASPGWSETGGPWVPPEQGMKKLVWGETVLRGGEHFAGTIARAPDTTGPFQTLPFEDDLAAISDSEPVPPPRASGRIAVLAVPLRSEALPQATYTLADGTPVDGAALADGDYESAARIPLAADRSGAVLVTYPRAVTLRHMRLSIPGMVRPFRSAPITPVLEAELDGAWREIARPALAVVPTTTAFAPVTARRFRLRIEENGNVAPPTEMDGVEGAEAIDIFSMGDLSTIPLADLRLGAEERVDAAEQKAGFATVLDYNAIASTDMTQASLLVGDVIDLTDRVSADGRLDWTPPAGSDWRVIDFGWSLTGKTNHPAPPEATGLEVDKYDPAAVRAYLETYLGMYRDILGDDLFGERGLNALLTDSIEVGLANWTPRMEAEFAARRGYALRPWMPVLTGLVVGSPEQSERFLADWRETLAEMVSDYHYGTVADVAHEHGLTVYGEALEDRRPLLGDDLTMRRRADVPMAALWAYPRGGQVRSTLVGDMRGAASTAHVYGQEFVAAESMTSANSPWAFAPRDLKRLIDLEFVNGINRPVIHTSVHVPVEGPAPGLSLMIFGQYFNRNETWADMARPWIDYMARSAWLLQQGEYAADVALFRGEEAPLTAQFASAIPPGLPRGHAYDFVNADMLADAFHVEGGMLVSAGGTRYRVLALGPDARVMTLPTLRRIAALVEEGATVVGRRPERTPSLADDSDAFAALVSALWQHERVIDSDDVDAALATLGLAPDFTFTGGGEGAGIPFLHRTTPDAEIYFLSNRRDRAESVEARFRVTGRAPELWDAITGEVRPLSFRQDGDVTVVPLDLGPEAAAFVVFREATDAASRTVPQVETRALATIDGPWTVSFQPDRGAPATITLDHLQSLSDHADEGVRYFSGVASYANRFDLPAGYAGEGPLWLDLGQVADVAEVFVNGSAAGITWFAPDRLDIAPLVHAGENLIEVRVANRWINRLIGDRQPGMQAVTFTAAPTYRSDAPLRPSGLIGPVTLRTND